MFAALIPAVERAAAPVRRLWRDREGIETVEWAVVAAVVVVVAVRAYGALSYSGIGAFFKGLATGFASLKINL